MADKSCPALASGDPKAILASAGRMQHRFSFLYIDYVNYANYTASSTSTTPTTPKKDFLLQLQ
jgi:hypothetical protein